jgi:hypothetical protein
MGYDPNAAHYRRRKFQYKEDLNMAEGKYSAEWNIKIYFFLASSGSERLALIIPWLPHYKFKKSFKK